MSEISVKMSEISYQTSLVHIYASKLLDGALLVITFLFHEGTGSCSASLISSLPVRSQP